MDCEELSDLEEGEIFEYEYYSPNDSKQDGCGRQDHQVLKNGSMDKWIEIKKEGDDSLFFFRQGNHGYVNQDLKIKLKLTHEECNEKFAQNLECGSSDGEYKSDEDGKARSEERKGTFSSRVYSEAKPKKKHSGHLLYGTVEDIMSEIGETISRKSRCNYKRRKSREVNYNLEKLYAKEETPHKVFWSQKVLPSHFSNSRCRKRKRKVSCDSDSEAFTKEDILASRRCRRRRRKEIYHQSEDEEEVNERKTTSKRIRDFDEVRRSLLEKLRKQKREEESKATCGSVPPPGEQEMENSDIQEVEMLIDCTNYVDNPSATENGITPARQGNESVQDGGEDELDVIKLRLIALASNRNWKNPGTSSKTETCGERSSDNSGRDVEDGDMDRSELLLRAEALKTALLKKHQKRLNKLQGEKQNGVGSSSDNDGIAPSAPRTGTRAEDGGECGPIEVDSKLSDGEVREEVACEGDARRTTTNLSTAESARDSQTNVSEAGVASNSNQKKANGKTRAKRKKKKSACQPPSRENDEKSEAPEEDDRTLRSQLLDDLMKKKSLKDPEGKSVLIDSMQSSANKVPATAAAKTDAHKKPPPAKRNALKKINVPKPGAPAPAAVIPKPQIQRIIVHLGSDDSSDDDLGVAAGAASSDGGGGAAANGFLPQRGKENREESVKPSTQDNEVIQAKYEKSVELLLSQARKKVEGEMRTVRRNPVDAPEAVYKHLPPSQRLEYLRLKQKIAERERLRRTKREGAGPSVSVPVPPPVPEQLRPQEARESVSSRRNVAQPMTRKNPTPQTRCRNLNGFGARVAPRQTGTVKTPPTPLPNKCDASTERSKGKAALSTLLLPSSQALISKLKLLLKKIKIEKCTEENYEKQIAKLKGQLNLFEKKKCEQRFKIKKLAEESMKIYKVIQGITSSGNKEDPKKKTEGAKEEEKTTPQAEGNVPAEGETGISEAKGEGELGNEIVRGKVEEKASPRGELLEYSSPLGAFSQVSDRSERVDPNVIVCQFDLMGVCKDECCRYQHFRTS